MSSISTAWRYAKGGVLSSCVYPSVCVCVCHIPVLYQNG